MINEDPNMGRKQIFTELPLPSKVEEKGILNLIYKGVFICVKLLLDIRLNLVKISEGKTIKTKYKQESGRGERSTRSKPVDNAVIKDTDNVTVEVKPDPVNGTVDPTEKLDDVKDDAKPETESGEKPTEQDEKSDEETKE